MKITIATDNPTKLKAVERIAGGLLGDTETASVSPAAKLAKTPLNSQIMEGALARARSASEGDVSIGVESGLANRYGNYYEETWCCAIFRSKAYFAYSSGVKVPTAISNRIESGEEHTEIMNELRADLNLNDDAWDNYTNGTLSRRLSFEEAIRNCLAQIKT